MVKSMDADHFEFSWTPPPSDRGAPIEGYIMEKRETPQTSWQMATPTPIKDTTLRLPKPKKVDDYEFRVRAINEAGLSRPVSLGSPMRGRETSMITFSFFIVL